MSGQPGRVLSGAQRLGWAVLGVLWLFIGFRFWEFWLRADHRGELALYIPATLALAYLVGVLPLFFWFYVGRMRRPPERAPAEGMRVAMITLCVPSHESIEIIERQLHALVAVRYPHDSWILDEGGDPEIERLATAIGVRYFTRRGRPDYNDCEPPFQAKTKAGNVNAWLDHIEQLGEVYECFAQLDIDHIPTPRYLDRTLGHFADPSVAWVQAPSVCRNLGSWTARGQAEQDLVLQGPLQMGFYGHSRTPFIIGSHTTYRTAAVYEINGFQPTRAEDHLDTVALAAAGYTGVYVPEIIASGEGPEDLGTYLGQQFAWAYSMVQILLRHTPRLIWHYRPRQAFQFLMAQTWYPLWSTSLAVLWVLPVIALLANQPIATIPLPRFLLFHLCLLGVSGLMWCWTRPWFQPSGVRLSWRSLVLEVARWPIVLWAVVNAVLCIERPYMITPKGATKLVIARGARLYGLYFGLALLSVGALVAFRLHTGESPTQGYLVLVLFNVVTLLGFLFAAIGLELRALQVRLDGLGRALGARRGVMAALVASSAAAIGACAMTWGPIIASLQ